MNNKTDREDEWDIPVHITESDDDFEPFPEFDEIDERFFIKCPVCGYDEFEDIYVAGKKMLRWEKLGKITFRWLMKPIQSLRCERCDYILNFARE